MAFPLGKGCRPSRTSQDRNWSLGWAPFATSAGSVLQDLLPCEGCRSRGARSPNRIFCEGEGRCAARLRQCMPLWGVQGRHGTILPPWHVTANSAWIVTLPSLVTVWLHRGQTWHAYLFGIVASSSIFFLSQHAGANSSQGSGGHGALFCQELYSGKSLVCMCHVNSLPC